LHWCEPGGTTIETAVPGAGDAVSNQRHAGPGQPGWSNATAASWCWLDGTGVLLPGSPIARCASEGLGPDRYQPALRQRKRDETRFSTLARSRIRPVNATYHYVPPEQIRGGNSRLRRPPRNRRAKHRPSPGGA
jgi:hypothetical protein